MQFNKYFSFDELTDSANHKELVARNREDAVEYATIGKRLSELLGQIREILGNKPIKVTSGFRNEYLNKVVGSVAKSSAHLRFAAADIIPSGMSVNEAFGELILNRDKLPELKKCIIEKNTWLHVEVKLSLNEEQQFYNSKDGIHFQAV